MRISDWSSDVCSSDLDRHARADREHTAAIRCARTGSRELTEITEGHGLSAACRIRCGAARCGASTVEDAGCRALRRSACCASGAADLIADTVRRVPHIIRSDEVSRSRSEEHTSELQSLMRNSYAVFC